jgi:hypothetical protein
MILFLTMSGPPEGALMRRHKVLPLTYTCDHFATALEHLTQLGG